MVNGIVSLLYAYRVDSLLGSGCWSGNSVDRYPNSFRQHPPWHYTKDFRQPRQSCGVSSQLQEKREHGLIYLSTHCWNLLFLFKILGLNSCCASHGLEQWLLNSWPHAGFPRHRCSGTDVNVGPFWWSEHCWRMTSLGWSWLPLKTWLNNVQIIHDYTNCFLLVPKKSIRFGWTTLASPFSAALSPDTSSPGKK